MSRFYVAALTIACLVAFVSNLGVAQDSIDSVVDFARDVAPILRTRCVPCHEGDGAKNGFIVSDRNAFLDLLAPSKSSESTLWTDYLRQPSKSVDRDSLVMPPDGPLSTAELTTLKVWIDEGASWPEGVSLSVKQVVEPKSSNSIQRIMRAFGHFHPAFVHFPIAFYLVSGLAVLGTYCFGARFRSFALACLYFAAFAGIVTALMGWGFADARGYPAWDQSLATNASHDQQTFFFHRWLGTTISIFGIVVAFLGWRARNAPAEKLGHVWRLGVLLLAALVAIVGHQGGELVYGDLIEAAIRHLDK